MKIISFLLLASSVAFADDFTSSDGSMAPVLVSGSSYSMQSLPSLIADYYIGDIVVFTHNGSNVARRIQGVPASKSLVGDPDFALRASHSWVFGSFAENVIIWMSGQMPPGDIIYRSQIEDGNILLEMKYFDYVSSNALGDSLFYVHALNRSATIAGDARTLSEGADSREIGTVHARNFVGIIPPSEYEE